MITFFRNKHNIKLKENTEVQEIKQNRGRLPLKFSEKYQDQLTVLEHGKQHSHISLEKCTRRSQKSVKAFYPLKIKNSKRQIESEEHQTDSSETTTTSLHIDEVTDKLLRYTQWLRRLNFEVQITTWQPLISPYVDLTPITNNPSSYNLCLKLSSCQNTSQTTQTISQWWESIWLVALQDLCYRRIW